MADGIQLPSSLYTAGAVPVNIEPSTNFAMQLAMKKQAREDSLNEYFQNQNKSINPDGLRPQDMNGFMQRYNDYNDYYSKNREAIQNPRLDNGEALGEFNSRHQDMLSYAGQSKGRQATAQEIAKYKLNPSMSYLFDTPDIINQIHQHDLPIDDPNGKALDVNELHTQTQPMSLQELAQFHKNLTLNLKPSTTLLKTERDQDNPGSLKDTYSTEYSDDAKRTMASRARAQYRASSKVRGYAEKMAANPADYGNLDATYSNLFGTHIQTPEDALVAEGIQTNSGQTSTVKRSPDYQARSNINLGRQRAMADYNQTNKINLMYLGKDLAVEKSNEDRMNNYQTLDNYTTNLMDQAHKGQPVVTPDENGKPVREYPISGGQAMMKYYTQGSGTDKTPPSGFMTDENGTYVKVVYPNGQFIKIPKATFNVDLGNAAKDFKTAMKPATTTFRPPGSTPGAAPAGVKPLAPGGLD